MTQSVLYLPSRPYEAGDPQAQLELRQVADGTLVLPAWTSPGRLVLACGEEQSWICVPAPDVAQLRDAVGAAVVVLDPPTEMAALP